MVALLELTRSCPRRNHGAALPLLAWLALALGPQVAAGQELEARAYAPNPVGARFLVATWSHSDGDVLLDASAPIQDFEISADTYAAGLGGTFALWDRLASAALIVPYIDATATGLVNEVPERADRAGMGDLRLRLTLSLLPGPRQAVTAF